MRVTFSGSSPEKVAKELEKAVGEYPQYAAAWTLLGETRLRMNDSAGAREAFGKSLEADPKYMRPYGPLLRLTLDEKDWTAVEELTDSALQVSPSWTQARYYLAVAQYNKGDHDGAMMSIAKVQESEAAKEYPQSHQLIGMIQTKRGAFSEAADAYRQYLAAAPQAASAEQIRRQLHEWEVLGVIPAAKAQD